MLQLSESQDSYVNYVNEEIKWYKMDVCVCVRKCWPSVPQASQMSTQYSSVLKTNDFLKGNSVSGFRHSPIPNNLWLSFSHKCTQHPKLLSRDKRQELFFVKSKRSLWSKASSGHRSKSNSIEKRFLPNTQSTGRLHPVRKPLWCESLYSSDLSGFELPKAVNLKAQK